jgi:hypothetical protein
MGQTVKTKHMKVLQRRLKYLQSLGEGVNSYDIAEIAALDHALSILSELDKLERTLEIPGILAVLYFVEHDLRMDSPEASDAIEFLRNYAVPDIKTSKGIRVKHLRQFDYNDIQEEIESLRAKFQERGWDDIIQYRRLFSVCSASEALEELLTQPAILERNSHTALSWPTHIASTGVGAAFGGVVKNPYPLMTKILYAGQTMADVPEVARAASKLDLLIKFNDYNQAEEKAREILKHLPVPLREVYRVVQVVVIPVKFAKTDDQVR